MAQFPGMELGKILEALRAVRDPEVNAQGLQALRRELQGPSATSFLADFLAKCPDLKELRAVWDTQLTAKNDDVIAALLLLLADLIMLMASSSSQKQQDTGRELVSFVVSRRIKALYFYLSSDSKLKIHAALALLSAVAKHSAHAARQLVHSFDFSLSALAKLSRLPRERKDVPQDKARRRLVESWQAPDPTKRPTASMFIDFALSLLTHADAALLQRLLPVRVIWSGLIGQLSQYPPEAVHRILDVIQTGVLSAGDSIPATLQAQPFGDAALAQIAMVAAWDAEEASAQGGTPSTAAACAAAQQMLLQLMTDPRHGIAPPVKCGAVSSAAADQPGGRRVLRLLQTLKVASLGAHYDLLLSIARQRPNLASAYLVSCQLGMDPKPSLKWLASMSVLGSLMQLSPDVDFPVIARRRAKPPGLDSPAVSMRIRCIFPPALPRGVIAKGLQHGNALVQQATLSTLCQMLAAIAQSLSSLEDAQAIAHCQHQQLLRQGTDPAAHLAEDRHSELASQEEIGKVSLIGTERASNHGDIGGSVPVLEESTRLDLQPHSTRSEGAAVAAAQARLGAWQSLNRRLRFSMAVRLPDLQALLTLHASLSTADDTAQKPEQEQQGLAELSGRELVLLHLLKVLNSYACCLPGTMSKAHFNAWQLLPQGMGCMHPCLQYAALTALNSSLAHASSPAASSALPSAEQLASLLQLLQLPSARPAIIDAAYSAAQRFLEQALEFQNMAEVHLWLDSLPKAAAGESDGRAAAVARFVAEAVTFLLRKPHEMWELQQDILSASSPETGAPHLEAEASLLPVTALRQAIRVAGSSKIPEASIMAVCKYVEGVLDMLLRFQHDPKPLKAVISGVLSRHASGGVAQNPDPAEQQQLAGSSQRPAKRAKRGSKEDSPAQIIADDRREAQDASSRQPDAGKRDTVQQQAHSQGATGAAMRALRSTGAGFTGRADESDDELDHDMAAEPSSIQGLLDAIAFKTGARDHEEELRLFEALECMPVRHRSVSALALVRALTMAPVMKHLAKGLRFVLVDRGGPTLSADRLEVLAAVFRQKNLLDSYLAPHGQRSELQADRDCTITELVQWVLEREAASQETEASLEGSAWPAVTASVQPYIQRALALLKEAAASQDKQPPGQTCRAYCMLAQRLPLHQTAAAALALLDHSRQQHGMPAIQWRTEHGLQVAAGLLKHRAVKADAAVALSQPQTSRLLGAIAEHVRPAGDGLPAECLAELLARHPSVQGQLAWQLTSEANKIVENAIAVPSHARCALAAVLLRALPLSISHAAGLFAQAELDPSIYQVAMMLPVMKSFLEVARPWEADMNTTSSLHAHTMCLMRWVVGDTVNQTEEPSAEGKAALHGCTVTAVLELWLEKGCMEDDHMLYRLNQAAPAGAWATQSCDPSHFTSLAQQKVELSCCLVRRLAARSRKAADACAAVSFFSTAVLTAAAQLMKPQRAEEDAPSVLPQLESIIAELLPELLSQHSMQDWLQSDKLSFMAALQKFAITTLRYHFRSASHLDLLRLVLAALPDGATSDGCSNCTPLADLAAALSELIMLHSECQPLMLKGSEGPLPEAAAQLAIPLSSLLPLVPLHALSKQEVSAKQAVLDLLATLLERLSWAAESTSLGDQWDGLVPALLMGYGATMSATDRAALRLLRILQARRHQEFSYGGAESEASPVNVAGAWTPEGPAGTGFIFGAAARGLNERGLLIKAPEQGSERTSLLRDNLSIDPRRCALTVLHWPEEYIEDFGKPSGDGSPCNGRVAQGMISAAQCAAYDAAFLLPFTVQVIQEGLMACLEVATSGLLAVVLRGLAYCNDALRGCAYEALALYDEALEASDFREKVQLSVLMALVRQSVDKPLQRLPTLTAVFLAEASCALTQPGCPLFPAINRHLLRRPALDLEEAPLLRQLLSSSAAEHAAERLWLVRLLAAGFRGQEEGNIFRRQFVGELLMSIHGSALADDDLLDAIEDVMCRVCAHAPTYAVDLVQHAGLVSWMSATLMVKLQQVMPEHEQAHGANGSHQLCDQESEASMAFARLLNALRALLDAKKWRTAAKFGSLGALQVFVQAASSLLTALSEHSPGWCKLPASEAVLEYALAVQQRIRSSWDAEMSQPPHQPWHVLAALLCAGQAMPEAHRILMLKLVLELPPPAQGGPGGFWMIACWALDAACVLCQRGNQQRSAAGMPQPQHGSQLQQGLHPPGSHGPALESELASLAARVLPWLASCMASRAGAAGSTGTSASLSAAASALRPAAATAQTAGASISNSHSRRNQGCPGPLGEACGDRETAERLVGLYFRLDGERRSETASAAAFALAQLLQPAVGTLLMRTASTDEQEPAKGKWRFLLGNTLLRMLAHLPLSAELTHHWQATALAASIKPAPGTRDKGQAQLALQANAMSAVNVTEKGKAALEMLMVMLPEFCMRQPVVLTISLLHQWRSGDVDVGRAGRVRQGLTEIEFRHARANKVGLK